ncbi:uncharacterized protein LOC124955456 isoform X1 [Vespa velutina]|uniref:uncharacterized protein LOC124955456 isoform X1 n=1 Tax=Vespa velutina TaxID=202808 RepID=UPI001FB38D7B|nr:uncharacterized protein LOC124955456 isoform X1 [Vespa velutina]
MDGCFLPRYVLLKYKGKNKNNHMDIEVLEVPMDQILECLLIFSLPIHHQTTNNKISIGKDDQRDHLKMSVPSAFKMFQIKIKYFYVVIVFMKNVLKNGEREAQWNHVILALPAGRSIKISSDING